MTAAMEESKSHADIESRRDIDESSILHYKSLVLDRETLNVYRGYKKIDLTPAEFDLLALFMHRPEQVLTKELIVKHTERYPIANDAKSLDYQVRSLRNKLGEPTLVQTVRDIGYTLKR